MLHVLRAILATLLLVPAIASASDSLKPAYSFKVYSDDKLFWEGRVAENEEVAHSALGVPGIPACYSPPGANNFFMAKMIEVYCPPSLFIMRGKRAAAENVTPACEGFLLKEEYIDHWQLVKQKNASAAVPVEISHTMCIGNGEKIEFTEKTTEGWLKQTTYKIEMTQEQKAE